MMTQTFVFRKAKLEDVESIAEFNIRMARETEDKRLDRNIVLKGVKAVIEDFHKGFYLVAAKRNDDQEIVGQLLITFEWSDWRNKYFWWIQSVYVDKENRNQKVFSSLLERIRQMAKSKKDVCGLRLYVEEKNKPAKKVYEASGMKNTSYEVYEEEI